MSLMLPEETDELIEDVYSLEPAASFTELVWERLKTMQSEMLEKQAKSARNAQNYLIDLSTKSFLGKMSSSLSDDTQGLSRGVLHAPTREISPSVTIVCLVKSDGGIHTLDDPRPINLEEPLSTQQVRSCLRASITINDWRVIRHFVNIDEDRPESFRQTAALRWHYPVVFEGNTFSGDSFTLHLDRNKGLQVII